MGPGSIKPLKCGPWIGETIKMWALDRLISLTFIGYKQLQTDNQDEEFKSLPQTRIFLSLYLCNLVICNPLIFQTYIFLSEKNYSLKCLRFTTLGCEDIKI